MSVFELYDSLAELRSHISFVPGFLDPDLVEASFGEFHVSMSGVHYVICVKSDNLIL